MAKLTVRGVSYYIQIWNDDAKRTLILLHGFTGSTATWQKIVEQLPSSIRVIAVDLLGHGQTACPLDAYRYTMEEQLYDLEEIVKKLQLHSFVLLGYSMGGRVALSYAVKFPHRVQTLLLESASPGLATAQECETRRQADDALANRIEQCGIEWFVNKWEEIPLFTSQKKLPIVMKQAIRQERLAQNAIGLANSLRGIGTGVQPSLWNELEYVTMPVVLITGELDEKFCCIAEQMCRSLPNVQHITVQQVGHAIHVENPTQFATIVKEQLFLSTDVIC